MKFLDKMFGAISKGIELAFCTLWNLVRYCLIALISIVGLLLLILIFK